MSCRNLRPERLVLRPERLDLRPERPNLRPERLDLRPERLDLRGLRSFGGGTDVRTYGNSPLCPTGHRPFRAAAHKGRKEGRKKERIM